MDLFVYGTLTRPDRVAALVDSFVFVGDATLQGLHPVEGEYPTLAPGGETPGRLLRTDDVAKLDAYEGVPEGVYARVTVPLHPNGEADVYVGAPDALGASVQWPGSGPFERRVRRYVADHDVVVRRRESGD